MNSATPTPPLTPQALIGTDEARLLSEVGFLALSKGMAREAQQIFEGLGAVRPDDEIGYIGRGLTALAQGDPSGATKILQAAPMSDAVATFLALALAQTGARSEARARLEDIVETATEPAIVELARRAVAEV